MDQVAVRHGHLEEAISRARMNSNRNRNYGCDEWVAG